MIEIKQIFEVDSYDLLGYYSEDHVNKEAFIGVVSEHIKEDVEEGTIDWLKDEIKLPTLEQVEYIWYKKTNLGEVDDYYEGISVNKEDVLLKEFNSRFHLGLYVEGHIDKELFLEQLLKYPKVINYLAKWKKEVRPIITVKCIEHCWKSCAEEPITFYEYWTYE